MPCPHVNDLLEASAQLASHAVRLRAGARSIADDSQGDAALYRARADKLDRVSIWLDGVRHDQGDASLFVRACAAQANLWIDDMSGGAEAVRARRRCAADLRDLLAKLTMGAP
jgi:hypothetical protein